jgi:sulfate adenylyltransferase subunit 2
MKTEALKQALAAHGFDAAFGGARRDEEKSRAKERVFSFRSANHVWDPKNQRPELWHIYNCRIAPGESIRVFPLSNWTELDVWPTSSRKHPGGAALFRGAAPGGRARRRADRGRRRAHAARARRAPVTRMVRFRTLGCYPLTGAVESDATTLPTSSPKCRRRAESERAGRLIDHDESDSMEKKKREGYF